MRLCNICSGEIKKKTGRICGKCVCKKYREKRNLERREEYLQERRARRESNKTEALEKQRIYREKNRESINEKQKEGYKLNPEKYRKWSRDYGRKNREKINLRKKAQFDEKTPEEKRILKERLRAREKAYRLRKKSDPEFKIARSLRAKLRKAIKFKRESAKKLLGCSIQDFIIHLESTWQEGMTWENYGLYGWHIDHIKPVNTFNLENLEERVLCFHFSNMRALWAGDNLSRPRDGSDLNFDTPHA